MHAVALGHHHVQIVRDQQHAEAALRAQPPDQGVELGLAREVDAAHRLVEHQQSRRADQRARQHHALQLAAGQLGQLAVAQRLGADLAQHALEVCLVRAPAELHEARDGERDGAIDIEALRRIADDEPRLAHDAAPVRAGSSPSSVRTSVVLPAPFGPITVTISPGRMSISTPLQDGPARARHLQPAGADQRRRVVRGGAWPCGPWP